MGILRKLMNVRIMVSLLSFVLSAAAAQASVLAAETSVSEAHCYRLKVSETPAMATVPTNETQTWCYEKLRQPLGSLFVFNADSDRARPELAFVLDADGILTHGSLKAGQITLHKVKATQFQPFSVPLREPRHLSETTVLGDELESSSREVLSQLLNHQAEYADIGVVAGRIIVTANATILPWRGYWWPYKGQTLSNGPESPMGKYDRFVLAQTGTDPGTAAWENERHRYKGVNWEGHCNGWVGSSILRAEPTQAVRDERSGVVFSVADQKGLLAETDYCVNDAFFGRRYRGRPTDDITDIYPAEFHKVLTYYIGQLQKPVAADHVRDVAVDNHVVSGYTMDIRQTGPNAFAVTAVLKMHQYDSSASNRPGIATPYQLTYSYTLQTDPNGVVIGGAWTSGNPDFLWVPLSPARCSSNNPRIDANWVTSILSLPPR